MRASILTGVVWAAAALPASQLAAAIALSNGSSSYSQDFDTLPTTGTGSTLPTGWEFVESGSNANTSYNSGNGNNQTGDTYSYGAGGSTDRAFGQLRSGTVTTVIGAVFENAGTTEILALSVSYRGEQWRLGNIAMGRVDRMDFQYSLTATAFDSGSWTNVDALDFTAPVTSGSVGSLDGNSAGAVAIGPTSITGLSIAPGSQFRIRWTDIDAAGADDGLAIDDFSITATFAPAAIPEASSFVLGGTICSAAGLAFACRRRIARRAA